MGLGERAHLARTGRRPADQPGRQLPAPFSSVSRAAEALGGTPRAATETVALPFPNRDGLMNDFFDNWTVQVRKGVLELCILNALAEQERYGYDLVKTLVTVPGLGVTEGTLYPLLSRLRVAGLVSARLEESTQGPARKYYSLTKDGRKIMAVMNDYLETLNRGTRQLLSKGGKYA